MKRFLTKCALFALILGGLLVICNAIYVRTNAYKNLDIGNRTAPYDSMPASIDVAVFGASHGQCDFCTPPEGNTFFNFSLSSQTPMYDLRQMRQFQDRIAPNGLVILTVSYISPFWQETEAAFAEKQDRYYSILSPENIIHVDLVRYVLLKYFPILTAKATSIVISVLHDPEPLVIHDNEKCMSVESIPDSQERILRDHWGVITPVFPNTEPKMMDAYRQMLTMCQEHGWTAVLVTPPYPQVYNDCFPDDFFPVFHKAVDSLCEEFNVPYLDYSHAGTFAEDYDLFFDIDHLNLDGAAIFDAQFYADLQAQGIWPKGS